MTGRGANPISVQDDATVPAFLNPVWEEYCAMLAATPDRTRHLRVHAGHGTYVHPDEWRFVTPDLIEKTVLVGRPEELVEKIKALEDAGLTQINLLPGLDHIYSNLERFSRLVMSKL